MTNKTSASALSQLLFRAGQTSPGSYTQLQILVINSSSVPGGQSANSRTSASPGTLPASLFNPYNTLKYIFTFLLISLPFIALANAGSPILWFNIFHLLFINAAIGYIESEILLKYKLANKVWTVILANYISMFVGFFVIMPNLIKGKYGGTMWDRNTEDLLYGLGISFIATLLIEYLFFVAALKDKKQKKILFKPFLIANIVTNVAMIFIYYLFMKASP